MQLCGSNVDSVFTLTFGKVTSQDCLGEVARFLGILVVVLEVAVVLV